MEIILQEDYPQLGYVGDKLRVRDGFARNYLIPRGIAVAAASRQGNVLKHQLTAINAKRAKLKKAAEEFAQNLAKARLEFTLKAGEQGKVFGSITSKDIETELQKQGYQVERRQIRITEALRTQGQHKIEVKLHSEVVVPLNVGITVEAPPAPPKEELEEKAARRSGRKGRAREDEEAQSGDESGAKAPEDQQEPSES